MARSDQQSSYTWNFELDVEALPGSHNNTEATQQQLSLPAQRPGRYDPRITGSEILRLFTKENGGTLKKENVLMRVARKF
jgi:hypothetical protein